MKQLRISLALAGACAVFSPSRALAFATEHHFCEDFLAARAAFPGAEDPASQRTHLGTMAAHFLHSLHGKADEAILRERRQQGFEALLSGAGFLDQVRDRLRSDGADRDLAGLAADLLADHGAPSDLRFLLEELQRPGRREDTLAVIAKALGRMCFSPDPLHEADPAPREAIEFLRASLRDERSVMKGAAILGLVESGRSVEALPALRELLGDEDQREQALQAAVVCRGLLAQEDADPVLRAQVLALAESSCEQALVAPIDFNSPVARLSAPARTYQDAVRLLQALADPRAVPTLQACFLHPRSSFLLGKDGTMNLRQALQRSRKGLDSAGRAALDELFAGVLLEAGERLFTLPEDPMTEAEFVEFAAQRDQRFNAASYFCELWSHAAEVKEALTGATDALAYLESLVLAEDPEVGGEAGGRLHSAVEEKPETRLLAARLIGRMEREGFAASVDVERHLVDTLGTELKVPVDQLQEGMALLRGATSPLLCLRIPTLQLPPDTYLMFASIEGLRERGWRVVLTPEAILVSRSPEPS